MEMVSIWMATMAFFITIVLAGVLFYLFTTMDKLHRQVAEMGDEIDELREAQGKEARA